MEAHVHRDILLFVVIVKMEVPRLQAVDHVAVAIMDGHGNDDVGDGGPANDFGRLLGRGVLRPNRRQEQQRYRN